MTGRGSVELESLRLASYINALPCYICEHPNKHTDEFCARCLAPLALAHQAANQKAPPRLVAAIGAAGVGKTVYLGTLIDMLSRQSEQLQVLTRGAFSINLQQTTIQALQQGCFPDKTPSEPDRWNWVHCQIRCRRYTKPLELIMPDMAGEALLEEVEHPRTYQVISSFLTRCAGTLVFIDATRLYAGSADQDHFTMKLLSYLVELVDDAKHGWPSRPVAIVLSKADQCDAAFVDPERFAEEHASGLVRFCRQWFKKHAFFAASVVGNCVVYRDQYRQEVHLPLRVEPRGLVDPFLWLLRQLYGRKVG